MTTVVATMTQKDVSSSVRRPVRSITTIPASAPANATVARRPRQGHADARRQPERCCFSFRQPPARLSAMICSSIRPSAGQLTASPS